MEESTTGAHPLSSRQVQTSFRSAATLTGQLIISGTVANPVSYTPTLQDQPLTGNPAALGQAAYFRLARFVSFLSFLVGYSPKLFGEIFKKLEHAVEVEIGSEEDVRSRSKDADEAR